MLKQKNSLDCTFLTEHGCELSMAVRPLVCRLHPYTYDVKGLAVILDPRCLLARQGSGEDLIQAMGMTSSLARDWHRQLYDEISIHEEIEDNEDRHNLRPEV